MTVAKYLSTSAASVVLGFAALSANAATMDIDVDGIGSCDGPGAACNVVLAIDLGAGSVVTGVGWDVTITPDGDSWYSEASALLTDSVGGQGISFSPGAGDDFAGSGVPVPYSSPVIVFADLAIADIVLADGILLIEFFESFDDVPDFNDAAWGGAITVEYSPVPVPAAFLLMLSGLVSAGVMRRKA